MVLKTLTPLSNFDLLDTVIKLRINNFRGVMRDQLPRRHNNVETGIILENKNGPGTQWVAYAIDPRGIIFLNVIDAISRNPIISPHKDVHEYTTSKIAKQFENTCNKKW